MTFDNKTRIDFMDYGKLDSFTGVDMPCLVWENPLKALKIPGISQARTNWYKAYFSGKTSIQHLNEDGEWVDVSDSFYKDGY